MLGIGVEYPWGSGSLGGRVAQHVEADPAGGPMVPRRQSAPVAALLAIPRVATQSAHGGAFDAGLRLADRPPQELNGHGRQVSLVILANARIENATRPSRSH